MPAGRPRTVSLPPDQMIELGKEMVEWVTVNNPIHLSMWYSLLKGYTDAQWRVMTDAPEFSPYYEKALKLVGYNYLLKNSDIEPSLKQRWQRVYFKDLRAQEDADKEYEANLSKEVSQTVSDSTMKAYEAHREQLQEVRKLYESAANIVDNMSKTDKTSA